MLLAPQLPKPMSLLGYGSQLYSAQIELKKETWMEVEGFSTVLVELISGLVDMFDTGQTKKQKIHIPIWEQRGCLFMAWVLCSAVWKP